MQPQIKTPEDVKPAPEARTLEPTVFRGFLIIRILGLEVTKDKTRTTFLRIIERE